jgi:hypothetical protein
LALVTPLLVGLVVASCFPSWAQASAQESTASGEAAVSPAKPVVPQQVRYAGKLTARSSESVEAVFRIYAAAEGGEPLWTETQQVSVAADGAYSVLLGGATPAGLPQTVFAGGAARWLGVSVERGDEQERVLLSSVPYAMKSADSESLAGHQAADFVTQAQLAGLAQKVEKAAATPAFQPELTPSGSGTTNVVPLWTSSSTLGNSVMTQSGAKIGINFAAPTATLEVGGGMTVHGTLFFPPGVPATPAHSSQSQSFQFSASAWNSSTAAPVSSTYTFVAGPVGNNTANPNAVFYLNYQNGAAAVANLLTVNGNGLLGLPNPAGGISSYGNVLLSPAVWATATTPSNSPLLEVQASSWSSSGNGARAQTFAWQAQPVNSDTASPSGKLALLYGYNGVTPAATGLTIAPNGQITFASGQQFPVTGIGGGTITGITTSSPLTGSGTTGSVALGLNEAQLVTDITPGLENEFNNVYAQLGGANTFAGGQVINGSASIGGSQTVYGPMLNVTNNADSISSAITATNAGQYGAGILGYAGSDGTGIAGYGTQSAGSMGVFGTLANSNGNSNSYFLLESDDGLDAGVWADGPNGQESALIATSDDLSAGIFFNDSAASSTILVLNNYSGGPTGNAEPAVASVMRIAGPSGMCGFNQSGSMSCTGQVKTVVTTRSSARQVETYSVQSAENWVEDYGSGQLVNGSATIEVEPAFAQTVNTGVEFHVFLTPGGDCKGLYVTHKTAGGFEVHELGGGISSIPFDYKIVAKRAGMERERLVDVTERMRSEAEWARFKPLDHPLPRVQRSAPQRPLSMHKEVAATRP